MPPDPDALRQAIALAGGLGRRVHDERIRRHWTLAELAARSGLSRSHVQWIEAGHAGSLEAYVRLSRPLNLRLEADLVDPRRRATTLGADDAVHGAMGEVFARLLRAPGATVAIDEPYQHYQFAGRADVLGWSIDARALIHIENRTRFPNLQEAIGSYNAKRHYLPAVVAQRIGLRGGFDSVTHVMACLWSSEVLHVLRRHEATIASVCPDPVDGLAAWLAGRPPAPGVTSSLIVMDPMRSARERLYVGLADLSRVRPRYRGYADAADRLRG